MNMKEIFEIHKKYIAIVSQMDKAMFDISEVYNVTLMERLKEKFPNHTFEIHKTLDEYEYEDWNPKAFITTVNGFYYCSNGRWTDWTEWKDNILDMKEMESFIQSFTEEFGFDLAFDTVQIQTRTYEGELLSSEELLMENPTMKIHFSGATYSEDPEMFYMYKYLFFITTLDDEFVLFMSSEDKEGNIEKRKITKEDGIEGFEFFFSNLNEDELNENAHDEYREKVKKSWF